MDNLSWSFFQCWNEQLGIREERPLTPRSHIWASELGGAYVDRFLKMQGVPQTNPPNQRSLRKFMAGNWFEWVVGMVLRRAGILIDCQEKLEHQYPGLLKVTGKLDFLAGGQPDWDKATAEISEADLPIELRGTSMAIVQFLREMYGDDALKVIVLEVKSVASRMFSRYESTGQANPNHRAQIFHYLKAKNMDEGHIVYISKDDCKMVECGIYNPSSAEQAYRADIDTMTAFYNDNVMPPLEREILFENFRFSTNWRVEYSGYLTKLYSYKEPIEYREVWDKTVASMNRTFKRCVTGAKMTDLNKTTIASAKLIFPEWDDLVSKAQEAVKKNPELIGESELEAA